MKNYKGYTGREAEVAEASLELMKFVREQPRETQAQWQGAYETFFIALGAFAPIPEGRYLGPERFKFGGLPVIAVNTAAYEEIRSTYQSLIADTLFDIEAIGSLRKGQKSPLTGKVDFRSFDEVSGPVNSVKAWSTGDIFLWIKSNPILTLHFSDYGIDPQNRSTWSSAFRYSVVFSVTSMTDEFIAKCKTSPFGKDPRWEVYKSNRRKQRMPPFASDFLFSELKWSTEAVAKLVFDLSKEYDDFQNFSLLDFLFE